MVLRVEVEAKLLNWAIERSGIDISALKGMKGCGKLDSWLDGSTKPTFKQIEEFAKATHTPVGFLFLHDPPEEHIPIPDFRTKGNLQTSRPSVNLLDTIYICQQQQEWYQDYLSRNSFDPLDFIGSVNRNASVECVAQDISDKLNFDLEARRSSKGTWEDALRSFIDNADAAGIMVMRNGVVQNNTHRKLDPEEFRGFALSDKLAPLIFINNADSKSAQMFTLAHELAHLWLGKTALSSADIGGNEDREEEVWCNKVAAELLVPLSEFIDEYKLRDEETNNSVEDLAKYFKVSRMVILRRMLDANFLTREEYKQAYESEVNRLRIIFNQSKAKSGGGEFYNTLFSRLSKSFAQALIVSTKEGQTLYRDAMIMMGVNKVSTINKIGVKLGI